MPGHSKVKPYDGLTADLPLPGFYNCITTQLNITAYRSGAAGRFVVCTRFPEDNLELRRDFEDVSPWFLSAANAGQILGNHMLDVEHLMGFRNH